MGEQERWEKMGEGGGERWSDGAGGEGGGGQRGKGGEEGHRERLTQCACSAAVVSQGRHGDALLEAPR